jgi:eukaryotic-like serine/threonine-protein kinase
MTMPPAANPGAMIAGKYLVESVLGRGGMGIVVAATNVMLGQRVAVKLLHPHVSEDAEQVARLIREARLAAQLKSEHVTRVLDVDRLDDGSPFIVLEYLAGRDLAAVIQERGPLPVAEAVDCILQALDVVAEAHRKGLVHRDLKPSNLFMTSKNDGSSLVKVLDFGIAKTNILFPDLEQSITAGQITMGSPAYMSPEQIREARSVDARADVWSIGVILYELITGDTPFKATTVGATFARIFSLDYVPLCEQRPSTPTELGQVVAHCLRMNVDDRIQDVGTLARLLSPFASERGRLIAQGVTSVLSSKGSAPPRRGPSYGSLPKAPPTGVSEPTSWGQATMSETERAPSGDAASSPPTLGSGAAPPVSGPSVGSLEAPVDPAAPSTLVAMISAPADPDATPAQPATSAGDDPGGEDAPRPLSAGNPGPGRNTRRAGLAAAGALVLVLLGAYAARGGSAAGHLADATPQAEGPRPESAETGATAHGGSQPAPLAVPGSASARPADSAAPAASPPGWPSEAEADRPPSGDAGHATADAASGVQPKKARPGPPPKGAKPPAPAPRKSGLDLDRRD